MHGRDGAIVTGTATEAGSTLSTGMHSCFFMCRNIMITERKK